PEFQAVRWEIIKVVSGVFAGGRVHAYAAILFDYARVSIWDDVRLRLRQSPFQLLVQILNLRLVGVNTLISLRVVEIVNMFHLIDRLFLRRIIFGADGLGALKGHVLEHVGDTGFTLGIVHRSRVHVRMERNNGGVVTLDDNEVQAIRERKLIDLLFKILQGLGAQQNWRQH